MSLTTLQTTKLSQSQVSQPSAILVISILYAYSNVFCHFYLFREEDNDDEHQELLQRDDPWEQPDQWDDDRQVRLQADPGVRD